MNDTPSVAVKPVAVDPKKTEPAILGIGGAVLLALAAFFTWRELSLASEVLAILGSALAAAGAWFAHQKEKGSVGPILLAIAGIICGVWYAATKQPLVLVGLGISFVVSLVLTLLSQQSFVGPQAKVHRALSWFATAFSGLAATFATYFFVFDASESSLNGFIARRALLTLAWLVSGTAMVVFGSKRAATEVRDAGYLVLGTSMVKMLLYDVGHDGGMVRIAALAVGGVVLVGASQLSKLFAKEQA